jgi:hypothetical protein
VLSAGVLLWGHRRYNLLVSEIANRVRAILDATLGVQLARRHDLIPKWSRS